MDGESKNYVQSTFNRRTFRTSYVYWIYQKNISMQGYLKNNLLEPNSLYARHNELVKEIIYRGMNHKSDLDNLNLLIYFNKTDYKITINRNDSLNELLFRCKKCGEKFEKNYRHISNI